MTESIKGSTQRFGSIEVPQDWVVDPQDRYAQTTKEKALQFFNEKEWESTILALAAIQATSNEHSLGTAQLAAKREEQDALSRKKFSEGMTVGVSLNDDLRLDYVRPIFFVTGGWQSYFWASAKDVVIEEIKSSEQMKQEFSGDVPEGKFFIKKLE